ncbi:hypothetical protein ILYODFUR_009926 [Ilyodon furcidens]|uniref:Ig-like domain-containing protein n=1 Tax=Ilyodon furcidens TaxID=33524 RepID=A0ABV0U6T5_9TELE
MNFYRLTVLLGASVCVCNGMHVTVREKKRYTLLFQPVVLQCQYQTSSTKTPVVQWWYKSYCRDHTRESFSLPETLGYKASELGGTAQVECSDSSRTVRIVASAQGPSLTLTEHYKDRDVTIINKADLRIGELQWGDSGVYFCKVIVADDLVGNNEDHMELLVLGRTGEQDDLLPGFDMEIMPGTTNQLSLLCIFKLSCRLLIDLISLSIIKAFIDYEISCGLYSNGFLLFKFQT